MGLINRTILAFLTTVATVATVAVGISSVHAGEWTSNPLNEYTSDSFAQLFWLPGDRTNPTTTGYHCTIETIRPTLEEGTIESGEGGIRCTNSDSEPFGLPFYNDQITAHGTRRDRVKFQFQGALQNFLSENLRIAIRASTTPNGRSTDPRVSSGDLCSPEGSFCLESMYLNDSNDLQNSGASLICIRNSDRVKKGHPQNEAESVGAWIDEEIRLGALKISKEYCIFTGP